MFQKEIELIDGLIERAAQMLLAEAAREGGPRGEGKKAPIDEEIEDFLKQEISAVFPKDSIVCEEGDHRLGESGRAFIIDPHDGTEDFLKGHRETSISIGMVAHGQLVLGAVYAPFTTPLTGDGVKITWSEGGVFQLNNKPLTLPPAPTSLGPDSRVLISHKVVGEKFEENQRALGTGRLLHCASVATRFALVAAGMAEVGLTVRHPLSDWDFAGGHALLKGQGGDVVGPMGCDITWENQRASPQGIEGFFGARDRRLAVHVARLFEEIIQK